MILSSNLFISAINLYRSNQIKISFHEGVIVSCDMEVASKNYLMLVGSRDSSTIGQFVAYSWQKLSVLTVTKLRKAQTAPVPGLK
jgi:hypothetical protein